MQLIESKPKEGYIIINANYEYNDETYYESGQYFGHKFVYATHAEAKTHVLQSISNTLGWMPCKDLWYEGDQPPILDEYMDDLGLENYWDLGEYNVSAFLTWCLDKGYDPQNVIPDCATIHKVAIK